MRRLQAFIVKFRAKFPPHQSLKAYVLLVTQAALLGLLFATLVLICIVREDTFWFYLMLVGILALINAVAQALLLSGRYVAAAWITVATVTLGPWGALLFDSHVAGGDFVPIVYVALSIQLCAILLSEVATGVIAVLQLAALGIFIAHSDALRSMNWPSLVAFIVFVAVLGSLSSSISRRQVRQIEKQHNRLLQDEAQLRELSVRDPLTGLYNRRYMEGVLGREVERALQTRRSLGVIMADVDDFKSVNDNFGHALGDQLLNHIAQLLLDNIRKTDAVCRYGGDEFVLVLPDCPMQDCMDKADRLRAAIEATECKCGQVQIGKVCVSLGVAALPDDGMTVESLLKAADDAMYAAKSEGKNRVRSSRNALTEQLKFPGA